MSYVIDLIREEGARVLKKDFLLYDEVEKVKQLIENLLQNNNDTNSKEIREFFASNIFISGARGTGKTSVLLTLFNTLENQYKEKVELINIIDVSVNYTGIIFYILSYFKEKIEKEFNPTDCCASSKLEELFDKLVNNFPKFLKCFCNNDCSFLCSEELEILLDQHEISFLQNFFEFIDKILKNKTLILILDDIDLIPEPKILLRTILELAVFLNHPKIIIIGAGDIENLKLRLLNALKGINFYNQNGNDNKGEFSKLYEKMVLSLLDKIFPITNRINLSKITPHLLEKIRIIASKEDLNKDCNSFADENGIKLQDFLQKHPTFKSFGKKYEYYFNDIVRHLFSDISLREFIQVLKSINRQINKIKQKQGQEQKKEKKDLKVKDVMVSKILLNLYFEDFIVNLKTEFDIDIAIKITNEDFKLEYLKVFEDESFIKELEEANFEAFVSFLHFIREIIFKTDADYLEGKESILNLIYTYNPKLSYLIQLWSWEINLYLKGHIYFYPLVYLTFLLVQGLHKNYFEKEEKEYVPELKEFIDSMLSSATTKENLYTYLTIFLNETIKSMQYLPKEFRNVLLLNLDVKDINNYYPILKFFKGFILITKLFAYKKDKIDEIKDWLFDKYSYITLDEIDDLKKEKESETIDKLFKNLKKLLTLQETNRKLNKFQNILKFVTIQNLDYLAVAYYNGIKTRIGREGLKEYFLYPSYLLPFYAFIAYYIDLKNPSILFTYLTEITKKIKVFKALIKNEKIKNRKKLENYLKGLAQILGIDTNKGIGEIEEKLKETLKKYDKSSKEILKKYLEKSYELIKDENLKIITLILTPFVISHLDRQYIDISKDFIKKYLQQNNSEEALESLLLKGLCQLIEKAFLETKPIN